MASVSSATSSLGNTSLRGFGGMASGIDRDSIIEQMTLGTTTKIANKKKDITSLEWKQEAYRDVIDKIIEMEDKYYTFSSSESLLNRNFFSRNQVTALGDSSVTKYITATGSSNMLSYMSILGVKQMATSASLKSAEKEVADSITTGITGDKLKDGTACMTSSLPGKTLEFGNYNTEGRWNSQGSFTFPSTYEVTENGEKVTKTIDYTTTDLTQLENQLNEALKSSNVEISGSKISDVMEFKVANGNFRIEYKAGAPSSITNNLKIRDNCSALTSLGFDAGTVDFSGKGMSISEFNSHSNDFRGSSIQEKSLAEYMVGKKVSVSYAGQTREIELVTSNELDAIKNAASDQDAMDLLVKNIQSRLDKAFGKDNVKVSANDKDGNYDGTLKFKLGNVSGSGDTPTLTVNTSAAFRDTLGIKAGASNKVSLDASLYDNRVMLFGSDAETLTKEEFETKLKEMKINGVSGEDLKVTADTTVNQFMNALNKNADAGVKATFLSATNQFVLIASETGSGREIQLDGDAALKMFGGTSKDGQNAQMTVSYGDGIETTVESSTNTFNLEGMNITVSGTFGYVKEADGSESLDRTKAVTFSAKADVDAATERVKAFIEAYNALAAKVDKEMTTRPDSDYGPLTDEQKDEMDDTSIENWEKKAKEGLMFGDSNLRGLSDDLQTVIVSLINNGINTNDLESIGITMGGMYEEGGKLNFDEAKFRQAMEEDPDKVADIICGGGDVRTGLAETIGNKLSTYATRFGFKHNGSNGCLVEVAGTEKISNSLTNNQIYNQLKEMQEAIEKLKSALTVEQDRYIKQFTTMEQMISQMNSQSSYLSSLSVG